MNIQNWLPTVSLKGKESTCLQFYVVIQNLKFNVFNTKRWVPFISPFFEIMGVFFSNKTIK